LKFKQHLTKARFVERLNRFAAVMDCEGEKVLVHIANSGRLRELFTPENTMYLTPADPTANRKTAYDLTLVQVGDILVSADARAPNTLLSEAIEIGFLDEFSGYPTIKR